MRKFKRGDLVKLLVGHIVHFDGVPRDIFPEFVGKLAHIEYSHDDLYSSGDVDRYRVRFADNDNSIAWKGANELELIEDGEPYIMSVTYRPDKPKDPIVMELLNHPVYGPCIRRKIMDGENDGSDEQGDYILIRISTKDIKLYIRNLK